MTTILSPMSLVPGGSGSKMRLYKQAILLVLLSPPCHLLRGDEALQTGYPSCSSQSALSPPAWWCRASYPWPWPRCDIPLRAELGDLLFGHENRALQGELLLIDKDVKDAYEELLPDGLSDGRDVQAWVHWSGFWCQAWRADLNPSQWLCSAPIMRILPSCNVWPFSFLSISALLSKSMKVSEVTWVALPRNRPPWWWLRGACWW